MSENQQVTVTFRNTLGGTIKSAYDLQRQAYLLSPGLAFVPNSWADVLFEERDGYLWVTKVLESAEGRYLWDSAECRTDGWSETTYGYITVYQLKDGYKHSAHISEEMAIAAGAPQELIDRYRALSAKFLRDKEIQDHLEPAGRLAHNLEQVQIWVEKHYKELSPLLIRKFGKRGLAFFLMQASLNKEGWLDTHTLSAVHCLLKQVSDADILEMYKVYHKAAHVYKPRTTLGQKMKAARLKQATKRREKAA